MPKRFSVPSAQAVAIASERQLVRHILLGNQTAQIPGSEAGPAAFLARFRHLQAEGFFYANPLAASVSWADLTAAQAEIARCHGLSYRKSGKTSQWVEAEDSSEPSAPLPARSETHLSQIFGEADNRNLKRIDLALLAHAHRVPIALLEAPDDAIFRAWVARIKAGLDPFLEGPALLEATANPTPDLLVAKEAEISWLSRQDAPEKGFVIRSPEPQHSEFIVGEAFAVRADFSASLGRRVSALLLGQDEKGDTYLLSTPYVVEDTLWHNGPVMVPRAEQLTRDHQEIASDAPGPLAVYLVTADQGLEDFPTYGRVGHSSRSLAKPTSKLTEDDFAWIRKRLLTTHPKRMSVLYKRIEILPETYDPVSDMI